MEAAGVKEHGYGSGPTRCPRREPWLRLANEDEPDTRDFVQREDWESVVVDDTAALPRGVSKEIEDKFNRLRDEWRRQRRHESSTMKVVLLPAYQKIIGIGPDAVPLLLRELETSVDNWFWALMAITEEDPVPNGVKGDGEAMARIWLKWGKDKGYSW